MDELDQELDASNRRDRVVIVAAACLCVLGVLWGLVKIGGVHFALYPHHWPF